MKLKAIKQKVGGRDEVARWEFRSRAAVEAMVRLWLRTNSLPVDFQEQALRDALGNTFEDYVEVTP